jgi:signal transduction histidine kinase
MSGPDPASGGPFTTADHAGNDGKMGIQRTSPPRWVQALLRVPLVGKIAGANVVIVVGALVAAMASDRGTQADTQLLVILASALGGTLIVNVILVLIALRPLQDLHDTAYRIWRGDLDARVPRSVLADSEMQRVGSALNALLDSLSQERTRIRALASQVIHAGDRERAHIARELHDSTAQTLAALLLELSVLAGENRDPLLGARLERVRSIASNVLDEVKLLAHTVHPRVLDDLGLIAALQLLAREAQDRGPASVQVESDGAVDDIPVAVTSVMYRVAQEAMNNAMRHGRPTQIVLRMHRRDGTALLEVEDNGAGFNVADAERRRPGMGLFTMRERAALVGGAVEITSQTGHGTRVAATIPLASAPATDARG